MTDKDITEIKNRLISIQSALDVLLATEQALVDVIKLDPDKADLAHQLLLRINVMEDQLKPLSKTISETFQKPSP